MNVNLLAITVGNTRTKLGLFLAGKLTQTHAILNTAPVTELEAILVPALEQLRDTATPGLLLASVNSRVAEKVSALLRKLAPDQHVLRVEDDLAVPIGRQVDADTLVGEDRLLNAAAAYDTLKQACIVIDAGTACTVDFIDGAGTFHGGAIAPGAQMMLNALHEHTAQLPQVTFARPDEPVGHNTRQAMLAAVFHGLRGMIRELAEQYAAVNGSYPMLIATGGNAELLLQDFDLVDRFVPDLTLLGLAVTWQHACTDEAEDSEN